MSTRSFSVTENEAHQRLDRFLRKLLEDVSLSAIYKLIRTRQITLNGGRAAPEARLKPGDVIVFKQAASDRHMEPRVRKRAEGGLSTRRDFRIVFEDSHLLCVNKPAGLLVHAGDRGESADTLIDQVTGYLVSAPRQGADSLKDFVRPSPTFAPNLAHRLDRDTSGLVLIGKTLPATQALTDMIKHRRIQKLYLALIYGSLPRGEGVIDVPLQRHEDGKGRRRKVQVGQGQRAVTRYKVLATRGPCSLVELELVTGRTHQLRAHLAHLQSPIVGDDEYGAREKNRHAREKLGLQRQFLHAAKLSFEHPVTREALTLCAPLWPDLARALEAGGFWANDLPAWVAAAKDYAPGAAP
ncbi:MAG: RluA family pseudouridine synthase [Planctomycetaceae bacterium]|nr:Ribosomal large subunit pseudouridine synthase C [Planctomycetota bacterium]MCQ3950334.1 RluA family pseudouridine synthase [Planctomycetota bacterium]NUO16999.1 RluA family pseudouridine synthase [Planctomycetaceae bacterium]GIK53951.1 MAG: pseudouridine synthase [Planctomycetota bacterium]HRJ80058.1 RluA family pseudouridine synthase [Planctomycetota bacterium]